MHKIFMILPGAYLNIQPGGDQLQKLAPLQTQTIRGRDIDQTVSGLAIETRQDIGGRRDVMVDLTSLELIEQFRGETFGQTRLSPVDAVVPVARSGGG